MFFAWSRTTYYASTCKFQLLKKDEEGNINKSALTSCRQIVDCLVENVLRLEEKSVGKATPPGNLTDHEN